MMLKQLKNSLKIFSKDKDIFDIVVYGSYVKGKEKPGDLDILVIFSEGKLKYRLEKLQKIKKCIDIGLKLDIKGILWEELFDSAFFGRGGIFLEGVSLFDGDSIAKKIGFNGFSIFIYNLRNKSHTEKVKFNYILSGRKNRGVVQILEGKALAPGVVQIPIKNSLEFETVLERHTINFIKNNVLVEI